MTTDWATIAASNINNIANVMAAAITFGGGFFAWRAAELKLSVERANQPNPNPKDQKPKKAAASGTRWLDRIISSRFFSSPLILIPSIAANVFDVYLSVRFKPRVTPWLVMSISSNVAIIVGLFIWMAIWVQLRNIHDYLRMLSEHAQDDRRSFGEFLKFVHESLKSFSNTLEPVDQKDQILKPPPNKDN